jgi:hypothetical protein
MRDLRTCRPELRNSNERLSVPSMVANCWWCGCYFNGIAELEALFLAWA